MTNEPEKIYLFENPITEAPDDRWLSTRSDDADIAELTKGTPYELRREVKQEYNRLVPQVRKFRHVTFDVFTDLNVSVLADNGIEADEADVAEASDLNYKMQLALYDKLGNTLWDTKKYLYLMNCIYGLSNSRTYEIRK